MSDYVKGQLADPVKEYTGGDAMGKLVCDIPVRYSYRRSFTCMVQYTVTHSFIVQEVKKAIIGHFKSADSGSMLVFRKVAISLRDDCPLYAVVE